MTYNVFGGTLNLALSIYVIFAVLDLRVGGGCRPKTALKTAKIFTIIILNTAYFTEYINR